MPGRASARSDAYDPATSLTNANVSEAHRERCAPAVRGSISTRSALDQPHNRQQHACADEGIDYSRNKARAEMDS